MDGIFLMVEFLEEKKKIGKSMTVKFTRKREQSLSIYRQQERLPK